MASITKEPFLEGEIQVKARTSLASNTHFHPLDFASFGIDFSYRNCIEESHTPQSEVEEWYGTCVNHEDNGKVRISSWSSEIQEFNYSSQRLFLSEEN